MVIPWSYGSFHVSNSIEVNSEFFEMKIDSCQTAYLMFHI